MPHLPDRPKLDLSNLRCWKCGGKPHSLAESGLHASKGLMPTGEGWIIAIAACHGEQCQVVVPFKKLRENRRLVVEIFTIPPQEIYAPFGGPDLYDPETREPVMLNGKACVLRHEPRVLRGR